MRRTFECLLTGCWTKRLWLVVGLSLTAGMLPGCRGRLAEVLQPNQMARLARDEGGGRQDDRFVMRYPKKAPVGKALDILVVRRDKKIYLTNRTLHQYDKVQLWLNGGYGRSVDTIDVGDQAPIELTSFVNQYGETYPVGQWLEPELDRVLVLAEIYVDGKRHQLTVQLEEDWEIRS